MSEAWIRESAWFNESFLKGPVRGVVVSFHGLGGGWRNENASDLEIELAENGRLVVHPYYGPWSWMNRAARAFVDGLLEAVYRDFGLGDDIPLVAGGGSMGGCSALLYTRYGRKRPAACDALYPVCDTALHFTERPDLPATFRHAFRGYEGTMEDHLKEHSPLAQVDAMPDIPFLVIHGDKDLSVKKEWHSDPWVKAMRALGRRIEYVEIPRMGHGTNVPMSVVRKRCAFILEHTTV